MIVDLYLVYSFIKRLVTPFNKWPAFAYGIIDARGTVLKDRRSLHGKERDSFGVYDLMILNLKKALAKIPGGNTKLATYAAALWLIKEGRVYENDTLTESAMTEGFHKYLMIVTEELDIDSLFELVLEDGEGGAPANNAGSGAIAGLGVGPSGEPGISKKLQKRIREVNGSK